MPETNPAVQDAISEICQRIVKLGQWKASAKPLLLGTLVPKPTLTPCLPLIAIFHTTQAAPERAVSF